MSEYGLANLEVIKGMIIGLRGSTADIERYSDSPR